MKSSLGTDIRNACIGAFLPAVVAASASAAGPAQMADAKKDACGCKTQYSIINLGPDAYTTALNLKGQAAFDAAKPGGGSLTAFFDGRRIHTLPTFGGPWIWLGGVNNDGVVVGSADDDEERSHFYAFSWTAAGGLRALTRLGGDDSGARAINDGHDIVGEVDINIVTNFAHRWNRDGSQIRLAPPTSSRSAAVAINGKGQSTGYADGDHGYRDIEAMAWDAAGRGRRLTVPGISSSYGQHINDKGQMAGVAFFDMGQRSEGFLWNGTGAPTPIRHPGATYTWVNALNGGNEVVGIVNVDALELPYWWSQGGGVRLLPLGGATEGAVSGLNNKRQMVGSVIRTQGDGPVRRAVLWRGVTSPVDLNSRLYRPPAGLVLYEGAAINDNGTILARSNAGLVMLRPGQQGTAAPVLGPIAGGAADSTVELGQTLDFTVGFVDSSATETHRASASVNDGCASTAPTVREARGTGEVGLRHTFCQPGQYAIKVKLSDSAGHATEVVREVTVVDPASPALIGKGTLAYASATGKRPAARPVTFALHAPLEESPVAATAARGSASRGSVVLNGPFHFHGSVAGAPVRAGHTVQFGGSGRLNGRPGYRFQVEAVDGDRVRGGADRLRVRISHTDPATKAEVIDYDNGGPAGTATMRDTAVLDGTLVKGGGVRLAEQGGGAHSAR